MKQIVKVTGLIGLQRKRCDMAHIIDESSCKMRCCNKCDIYRKELQHYKDLAEKGLLVELPCKVGDTVYLLDFENSVYDEATVELVKIENEGIFIDTDYEIGTWEKAEYIRYSESEAEQALADMN